MTIVVKKAAPRLAKVRGHDTEGVTPVQDKPTWEKVPNAAGLFRRKMGRGYVYRFRRPGERNWIRIPGHPDITAAKRWHNIELGKAPTERLVSSNVCFYDYEKERIQTREKIRESTRR